MNADTIKALATYATAFSIVVGGLVVLYLTRAEPTSTQLQVIVAGFIGSATTFLFVQENSTRASRSAERQMDIGVKAGGTGTNVSAETVTTGGPTTVTPKEN